MRLRWRTTCSVCGHRAVAQAPFRVPLRCRSCTALLAENVLAAFLLCVALVLALALLAAGVWLAARYWMHVLCCATPLAFLVALLYGPVWYSRRRLRLDPRLREGHCRQCGYDLRASQGQCPECGERIPDQHKPSV